MDKPHVPDRCGFKWCSWAKMPPLVAARSLPFAANGKQASNCSPPSKQAVINMVSRELMLEDARARKNCLEELYASV